MLGIDDAYVAYCVDEAVGTFGANIVAELNAVKGKNEKSVAAKQETLLKRLLADSGSAEEKRTFAQPVATTTAKVDW